MRPFQTRLTLAAAVAAALAAALGGSVALAQHAGHGAPAATAETASTKAYREINAKMHRDMDIAYTGDAEVDFMRGMIPHHEGAVAMAKVVLGTATDPVVRKLAGEVIAAQESEIRLIRDWLKAKGR